MKISTMLPAPLFALALLMLPVAACAAITDAECAAITTAVDGRAPVLADRVRAIWGFAEVGYQESCSSALLQ